MEFPLIIMALLALLVVAFWGRMRFIRRASAHIIERFREHGAIKKDRAKTLEEMNLRSKPKYPFLTRDNQVEALSLLLRQGIIQQVKQTGNVPEARFYLDEQKYDMLTMASQGNEKRF